jgi:Polyketide cyclase / dehydrase and lipid transport
MASDGHKGHVYESTVVNGSVDDVWALIGEFYGLHKWHVAVTACTKREGDENVRVLAIGSGDSASEVVEVSVPSTVERESRYRILSAPFEGLSNYEAYYLAKPVTTGTASPQTFVEWTANFDSSSAETLKANLAAIHGVFTSGFEALRSKFPIK